MDDLLPSYESAIERDPWIFIAPYLLSNDLCSAALVCKKWHAIFTSSLWGSPASHFGFENDVVYVALTRFKRTLPFVRPHVRELTHTLHFPPAHAEIYDGPHSEWLRDCLEYLPKLQCLIVDGLPFFDHASLLHLRYPSLRWKSTHQDTYLVLSLRLLDAAGCTNATSTGLAEALPHFRDLVSLDLSRTLSAKNDAVLRSLSSLRNLRVLTLRSLNLKDVDFGIIAQAIGTRVRSLDISSNSLTDSSARLLLSHCLKETRVEPHLASGHFPPVLHTSEGGEIDAFEAENLVDHLRHKLTGGFVGSLAIEEARDVGITHLYLPNNAMTIEGISGLLRCKRLQVFDIGTLPTHFSGQLDGSSNEDTSLKLPPVSKLGPVLHKYASKRLKYLRVNFELITEDAPQEPTESSPRAEMCGDLGRQSLTSAHELEAIDVPAVELDATETTHVEAEGDFTQPSELQSPKPAPMPPISVTQEPLGKCGLAYASKATVAPHSPSLTSSTYLDRENAKIVISPPEIGTDNYETTLSPLSLSYSHDPIPHPGFLTRSRHNSSYHIYELKARLQLRQSQENRLHPGTLPKVHTLVLTDVPLTTNNANVVERLIQFIKDAAAEASIAKQRARHSYALPPGRSRAIAEQEYARSIFSLRRIVLEMAPPQAAPKKISTSWRAYPTKSSTEDADSEAFWEAATQDFSFFDDQECGLPTAEPGRTLPLAAMSGLELAPTVPQGPIRPRITDTRLPPTIDIIGELGKFRKDKKAAYQNLVRMGELEPEVEGYWPGDVTVIRKRNTDVGELDCYGNRYESGWYYR